MSEVDIAMVDLAAKQHSLFRLHDILASGGSKRLAAYRVSQGRWERVYEGVYRIAGVPWTYEARVLAAVFGAGDGAVASHKCAARLHGIGFGTADVEITIPRGTHFRPVGVKVHTSRDLDRTTHTTVDGTALTEPARTLLDLASQLGPDALKRAIEQARRLELVEWDDLAQCLAAHARKGRRGISRLRQVVVDGIDRSGLTETTSELIAYTVLKEHGYDSFVTHHQLRDADGELFADMDLADIERRINLEIDGPIHKRTDVRRRDASRDSMVRRNGWIVERIEHEIPVYEPREFLRIVAYAIKDASRRDG